MGCCALRSRTHVGGACDACDARAAWDVRARAGAAQGVGPPAFVFCPAGTARLRRLVVFSFAFSTRPGGGKPPTGNHTHTPADPGTGPPSGRSLGHLTFVKKTTEFP